MIIQNIIQHTFAEDILKGLSDTPKHLSSKYFYDDEGSRIFQDIMRMPEYYLTNCELEIFQHYKDELYAEMNPTNDPFEIIELGAGDGLKTKVLLSHFLKHKARFKYLPVDISSKAVENLIKNLKQVLPTLETRGKIGDYFQIIQEISQNSHVKKIVLFLGSNIGNFNKTTTVDFLNQLQSVLNSGDLVLFGFDLKKDQHTILQAYNDHHGYTAAFNLNLLKRINKELNANFQLHNFYHIETYDTASGTAKSFLKSLKKQEVIIRDLNLVISFEKNEHILMEISQKYDLKMISNLAKNSCFEIVRNFYDSRQFYTNSLWKMR